MTQQIILLFIGALFAGLLGGGIIAKLAISSLVAKLREDFRATFATQEQLNGFGTRVQKVEESKGRLFQGVDDVDKRLIRVEERVIEPMQRIVERLDKMEERDAAQTLLIDRATQSLDVLQKAVGHLTERLSTLNDRLNNPTPGVRNVLP